MPEPSDSQINELRVAIETLVRAFKIVEPTGGANAPKLNPADVQALLFIHRNDLCIATDLGTFLGVVPTTNSAIIDRLVRHGLVSRKRTETNRRIVQLSLTEDGRDAAAAFVAEQNAHSAAMLRKLAPEERSAFVAAMAKIARESD